MLDCRMAEARGKVLVIDDDPLALNISRARLEHAGFEVQTRKEAFGTTQVIFDWKPDVVLLDLNMPALGGASIADLVKKHAGDAKVGIIFHSSRDLLTIQDQARQSGILGAIAKTADDAMFIAQFERLFERHRRRVAVT